MKEVLNLYEAKSRLEDLAPLRYVFSTSNQVMPDGSPMPNSIAISSYYTSVDIKPEMCVMCFDGAGGYLLIDRVHGVIFENNPDDVGKVFSVYHGGGDAPYVTTFIADIKY